MRKYGKLALTLGLLAAAPGWSGLAPEARGAEKGSAKKQNQEVAEDIAAALRAARVSGQGMEIEFKNGVARLKGEVADARMKARAEQVVERVRGVESVSSELTVAGAPAGARGSRSVAAAAPETRRPAARPKAPAWAADEEEMMEGGVMQASHSAGKTAKSEIQQVSGEIVQASMEDNQAMAEQIAGALSSANLDGYDIEISYQNGVATLGGQVAAPEQRMAAERVVGQIPGVRGVRNNLMIPGAPRPGMMGPGGQMGPAGYPGGPGYPPVRNVGYQGGPGMMDPAMGAGGPPPGYGAGGPGMSSPVYNSPSLPDHAWPTYAQYPNSAAVNYPQQYSASAFPYIGPFYPYPQVPLGWRDATLRWDDGQWNLQFRQRTDKWWWFLHPKNW